MIPGDEEPKFLIEMLSIHDTLPDHLVHLIDLNIAYLGQDLLGSMQFKQPGINHITMDTPPSIQPRPGRENASNML
ncbi:MAG: hypothetical protein MUO26_02230 [Methanotrichaceae archaeon]|nr:hypothetical protein [Methanotrichaceae archaeon]